MSKKSILLSLPIISQNKNYTCGVSVIRSIIEYNEDVEYSENEIAKIVKADPKFGTKESDIIRFFKKENYEVFYKQNLNIEDVLELLDQKQPIITCIQAWSGKKNVDYSKEIDAGHYVIMVGHIANKYIIFMDPALSKHYGYLTVKDFEQRWHGDPSDKLNRYGLVVIGRLDGETAKIDKQNLKKIK